MRFPLLPSTQLADFIIREISGLISPPAVPVVSASTPLAEVSQFAGLEGGKCFGMSEGYRKVFTTRWAELRQSGELFARL
jgi:hypothetical protein